MPHHDLVIVGSGSGNSLVGPEFDDWDIALVEENNRWFGGTCLNVGCIPTKMFVYPAEVVANVIDGERLGLHGEPPKADWAQVRDRIFGRIDAISEGGREYRRSGSPNVTLYEAHARFTGPRELTLSTGETLTADRIVLATGSRPFIPPVVADSGVPFFTSDTIMRIDQPPDRLIVLGAGYIAAEFAHIFTAFGTQVRLVARTKILSVLDEDVRSRFADLVRHKWNVHDATHISRVMLSRQGIEFDLTDGSVVCADALLVAAGRVPNSDRLDLHVAGIETDQDGRIVVDAHQRTSADGVWALGDASNRFQLKHVANHEARVVAHNLAHPDDLIESDHRFVPAAVFTHPQIAYVGMTEADAKASGRRYVTAMQAYGDTAYGWAMEDTTSVCKLVADADTGQLLGAHIMGQQASTLIQPLIQAMSFGLGVREMARGQYWIHPALAEVVENALLKLPLD